MNEDLTPDFIVYEVDNWLFVIGDENRVDVQLFSCGTDGDICSLKGNGDHRCRKLHPDSALLFPLKLFVLNNGMVRVDCPDKDRMVFVSAAVRRDGLELPDVYSLAGEPSARIRGVSDWCENIILAAAHGEGEG